VIKLKDILIEGVYDKTSLKAVIMSGGPGSGKTTVAKELFAFDKTLERANLSAFGMKRLDSDYFYTKK
jgi:tRNA uridine 5-carbamoylmethylation protein Kti12